MKLQNFKPLNAWSQLSDENKQRILDISSIGELYANLLMSHTVSNIPWTMYSPICAEFKIEGAKEFYGLFNIKL